LRAAAVAAPTRAQDAPPTASAIQRKIYDFAGSRNDWIAGFIEMLWISFYEPQNDVASDTYWG
jgi:hypothetical protein